jgi:hypothetical protein
VWLSRVNGVWGAGVAGGIIYKGWCHSFGFTRMPSNGGLPLVLVGGGEGQGGLFTLQTDQGWGGGVEALAFLYLAKEEYSYAIHPTSKH